jgi:hypothetical protein
MLENDASVGVASPGGAEQYSSPKKRGVLFPSILGFSAQSALGFLGQGGA